MAEATAVSFRKGSSTEHQTFRGVEGEITVDLTDRTVWVHPGHNEIGTPLARADMGNVTTENIASRDIARSDLKNITINNVDLPGIKLKLDIPTKTSQLVNDSGYINDISSAVGNATITIKKNTTAVGSFTANTFSNTEISIPVPVSTSELTNDSGYITKNVNDLVNYTKNTDLAAVAISGSYSDLSDKPNFANVALSGSYNDLTNKPNLAAVATSGSYNDLSNKPTIVQPLQSDWDAVDEQSLAYIQNKPLFVQDIVVTVVTGVVTLTLSDSFYDPDEPTLTPIIKSVLGGVIIAGTWAPVADTDNTQWTFTPTNPADILSSSWIILING